MFVVTYILFMIFGFYLIILIIKTEIYSLKKKMHEIKYIRF